MRQRPRCLGSDMPQVRHFKNLKKRLTVIYKNDNTSPVGGSVKVRTHFAGNVTQGLLRAGATALSAAALAFTPAGVRAASGTKSQEQPQKPSKAVVTKVHATKAHRTASSKSKAAKPHVNSGSSDLRRRAAMRPEPQRVQEIQKALIDAGKLNQEPTGRWDDATRDAMKRYQEAHGVAPTGLPDAKSLMRMGLGPHPLPPEVETAAANRASLDLGSSDDSLPGPHHEDLSPDPDADNR